MKTTIKFFLAICILFNACSLDESLTSDNNVLAGSYSTMLPLGNKLYVVSKTKIFTYDATDAKDPILLDTKELGFDIESLIHHDGLLLIGSKSNMYIFSLDENGIPVRESQTEYFGFADGLCNSDPIVVRNSIAYVTLSTIVSQCGNSRIVNELRVYNITDFKNPILINQQDMSLPKGLGLGKEKLFICDGIDGLIILDIKNPKSPLKEKAIAGFEAYDLIVKNEVLMVVAKDELLQFDISIENDIKLLSTIEL